MRDSAKAKVLNPYKPVTFSCLSCGWSVTLPQLGCMDHLVMCMGCGAAALQRRQANRFDMRKRGSKFDEVFSKKWRGCVKRN